MPRIGVSVVFFCKFLVLACMLPIGYAQAAVYYVDQKNPAASDLNPGTKVAPWLSLYPTTQLTLKPGDMVLVREGLYNTSTDTDKNLAMINPQYSGKPGRPITFKSSPAFAATIVGHSHLQAPVQITDKSHIAIEGFKIVNPGKNGILISGDLDKPVDGVAIRNNIILNDRSADSSGFTDGIHIEYAKNIVIDNNRIAYKNKVSSPVDSSAINLSNVASSMIEYNEIESLSNGISLRNNVINTKLEKNIISNSLLSIQASAGADTIIKKLKISNNIFTSTEVAISLSPDGGVIRKSFVNNNVFNDYSVAAMQIVQPGMGKVKIWNNIFKRGEQGATFIADIFTYDDPPLSIARMDYNMFAEQPLFITGLYSNNRRLSTLKSWQDYAEQDAHSVVSDLKFRDLAKNDFRLVKNKQKVIKGTVDGKPSSKGVEVGAYTTAITHLGVKVPSTMDRGATKVARSTKKTSKKTDTRSSVDKIKKNTAQSSTKQKSTATNKGKDKSSTQLAIVGAGKETPISKSKQSKLVWEVDRRLKFGGKCVLESNKIDFFDGHDNTGLKFRVMNDELFLLTKSNIDMSFNDVGVQVGKNEFLHADHVVKDQNVVINKEMPKFLTQLRKTNNTRVQLRFWPTYPATQAYSEVVTLDGFLSAYKAYQDCKQGN